MCFDSPQTKRSLGQGNIFAPVCHSVHGGREYLGRYILPEQVHPPRQVHPLGRYTPNRYTPRQVHPLGMYTPQAGTPPWAGSPPTGTPPGRYTPQQVHPLGRYIPPGRYTPHPSPSEGQCAGGTHPTGMHSCYQMFRNVTDTLNPTPT